LVFASTIITTLHANQTIILFLMWHSSNIVMGFFLQTTDVAKYLYNVVE